MDIGVTARASSDSVDPAELAKRAEELGFESFLASGAPYHPRAYHLPLRRNTGRVNTAFPWQDIGDPLIALARASAATSTIKLGTSISLVPEHNPLMQAKQIATLDKLSGGRFLFGIGAGWLQEETEIMGGDFRHRWGQTREAVLAMKELWTKEEAEFHGRFFDFPPSQMLPQAGAAAAPSRPSRRLPLPTCSNAWWRGATAGCLCGLAKSRCERAAPTLDELAEAAGRDPSTIQLIVSNLQPDRDVIARYGEAGANRVTVALPPDAGAQGLAELERLAEQVL